MSDPLSVLASYPVAGSPMAIHFLGGAGGFSGARIWRVEGACGPLCLRRWPVEHPQAVDLDFIHSVLFHVARNGFDEAAVPIENLAGASYIAHSGHLWEVAPWMPGRADFTADPTEARLRAAMECIARFHRAAERFCWTKVSPDRFACPSLGQSPGIRKRGEILRDWLSGRSRQLEDATNRDATWPEMRHRAERLLRLLPKWAPSVAEDLAHFDKSSVPLQPCIRDIWHDHLLFREDEVSGLIDFGSMGVDNVACDVARLLGSLVEGSRDSWRLGLEAYTKVRGLSDVELGLVHAFDRSGVLIGALNWAAWTLLEGRVFENPKYVLQRMDLLLERLERESPIASSAGRLLL